MGTGIIAVPSQRTWFVSGPNGVPGLSVLNSVGPKVQRPEGDVWNNWEVTDELDVALVKLNRVSSPVKGHHVQVGLIWIFKIYAMFP